MKINNAGIIDKGIRLHLTNIIGLGAVRLLQSLLPVLVNHKTCKLEEVYLPLKNEHLDFTLFNKATKITYYKRYLPNAISRFLECIVFGSIFDGKSPLLVLGDLPIKCKTKQIVFLQNSLLLPGPYSGRRLEVIKYWFLRWVFEHNLKYVSKFIVQTDAMKSSLVDSYPEFSGRIDVIPQPVPAWLLNSNIKRTEFTSDSEAGLKLFYPAAFYPHKHHIMLSGIDAAKIWPVSEIILTIPDGSIPLQKFSFVRCIGLLSEDMVLDTYRNVDALLFLSLKESYGFPLIEAMWLGIPIICCDLAYTRALCGDQAIYFDPHSLSSLYEAVSDLNMRRSQQWWPDWSTQLSRIPKSWESVADKMIDSVRH